ncbi:MAG: MraY family glycosyltransferase [Sphingobacteriaceae bacterium]
MVYLIFIPLFFAVMLLYFKIADRYNIIDQPNERSSHTRITIRGGGIIYLFAAAIAFIWDMAYWMPILGIFVIGIISFLDDQHTLSSRIRILFHLIAVTLLFMYLQVFSIWSVLGCIALYILVIGIINAYNFMDGINGITGAYSLVVLSGLQYVNLRQVPFMDAQMIWLPMLASVVFLYFNFRRKARCFAGDVGSVTVAFWIIFLLFSLISQTHNWTYMLFLVVYGVDTVLTIVHRLLRKENIFEGHRLHFYQLLANEHGMPQLWVSSGYALLQLLIIGLVVFSGISAYALFAITLVPLVLAYAVFKPRLMRLPV